MRLQEIVITSDGAVVGGAGSKVAEATTKSPQLQDVSARESATFQIPFAPASEEQRGQAILLE